MKKFFVFIVLTCLLGNRALAQGGFYTTETIDFTVVKHSGNPQITIGFDSNNHPTINNQVVSDRLTVEDQNWVLWGSDTYNESYLQKRSNANTTSNVNISGLNVGDVVTIWGETGNTDDNAFNINSKATIQETTYTDDVPINGNPTRVPNTKKYLITEAGTVTIQFAGAYSGIRKITITSRVSHFDYDPGYEEYDMYDEFSENNKKRDGSWHTIYNTNSPDVTGFNLNGQPAKYIVLSSSKITANNRIAIYPYNNWRFNYGLRSPSNTWGNFSICNLREGDRVVFSYTGTPPVFSSNGQNGSYDGSKAFFDKFNDGVYDEGEDVYITSGATPETDWYRGEGNIYAEDNNGTYNDSPDVNPLRYTRYVITEDGHLDLAIAPDTRIVKIKIYSDHQASMVDEYDAEKYTAKFDITGELQAMEHIVPGGLEVHVGNNDASQHAHVVSSPQGPVSIVNGVNGYKLPGMSLDANGNLQFQFNLANNVPETGTFYKFMPLEDGKMTLTFQAASMNYYSYAIDGDAVYYGTNWSYDTSEQGNIWTEQFDRPNEQTRNVECPYYLVKVTVQPDGTLSAPSKVKFTYKIKNSDGVTSQGTIDPNDNDESKRVLKALNGADITISPVDEVKDNEIYYLYGGWNTTGLSFNGSGQGRNNLEYLPYGAGNGGENKACGVAKLLEVVFNPKKKSYPLAKWVPNGTMAVYKKSDNDKSGVPNPDNPSYADADLEYELADLHGYNEKTPITVKKMSGNIIACHPFLQHVHGNDYKLMIDGIQFGDGDKGGTILIKIGETKYRENPVYVLTIAYSSDDKIAGTRGHIWDYSSNSLHGFDWEPGPADAPKPDQHNVFTNDLTANSKYAQPADYGHYFTNYLEADISNYSSVNEVLSSDQNSLQPSGSGLLYNEIHAEEMHSGTSDWKFNYNLVNNNQLFDPVFLNKFDLEGDNADLIWETEGTVFKTSANGSVMFNEFTGADIHQSTKDPDRYVGILKGGEFRIPWLRKNDRVIIYMGTGKGAFNDHVVFNIRGAYDAVHNEIKESDDYIVGGSQWNYYTYKNENDQDVVNDDRNYRGCYHFFATGDKNNAGKPADMVFKMTGGSMCKIYKIQIYRGDRIITNEVIANDPKTDKFLLWSRAKDPNDANDVATKGLASNWTLQYFGKNQKLADNTNNVNNDIVAQTGHITKTLITETDATKATYNTFTYPHTQGEIGTIRVRAKDMEKNMKYVADYGEHNVTIAYQETQKYPYTWDFMDMTGYKRSDEEKGNIACLFQPEDKYEAEKPDWFDTDATWDASYEKTSKDLSLWETQTADETYYLRLNSQALAVEHPMDNIFESAMNYETATNKDGNQVWANHTVVPETQGLWFSTEDNNTANGGQLIISDDGMQLNGSSSWPYRIVVPNVPAGKAVYLRMRNVIKTPHFVYNFEGNGNSQVYGPVEVSGTSTVINNVKYADYVFAIMNNESTKRHLTFSFGGYLLKKLAVSTDFKTLNVRGWNTESRDHVIDPELTAYLTGKNIETCIVTGVDYAQKTINLKRVYTSSNTSSATNTTSESYVMSSLEDGDKGASILHNEAAQDLDAEDGEVKILNNGFHLFVPDMHDYGFDKDNNYIGEKTITDKTSMLVAQVSNTNGAKSIPGSDGDYTNYALTYKHFKLDANGNRVAGSSVVAGDEAFYRIAATGASSGGNQGYLPLLTAYVNPYSTLYGTNPSSPAKFSIVFDEEFVIDNSGIATQINEVESSGSVATESFYNLNGQKMNGKPTQKGLYIVNGKKVLVK